MKVAVLKKLLKNDSQPEAMQQRRCDDFSCNQSGNAEDCQRMMSFGSM